MAALAFSGAARAQDGFVNVYNISLGTSANALGNLHAHQNLNRYLHHWDSPPKNEARGPLLVPTPLRGQTATAMAAAMPEGQRAGAEQAFRQALDVHGQVLAKFGVPANDLAGAFAAYLAGAWMAYHNASFPDRDFLPLVNQMRRTLAGNDTLAKTSADDRRTMHERLAIVGVLLASSQVSYARNPGSPQAAQLASNMRRDGRAALEQMLGVDADRVQFGQAGLVLR